MSTRTLTIAAAAIIASSAFAAAQTNVGTFGAWSTFTSEAGGSPMCFVASVPTDSKYSQPITSRDPVFFMVTSIPAKSIRNEVSTIIGYGFGPNTEVTVNVDGTQFKMFTANTDTAWAVPEQEADLVEAMKKGRQMTVQGLSKRGTVTTDTYSLSGVTAALAKATSECP